MSTARTRWEKEGIGKSRGSRELGYVEATGWGRVWPSSELRPDTGSNYASRLQARGGRLTPRGASPSPRHLNSLPPPSPVPTSAPRCLSFHRLAQIHGPTRPSAPARPCTPAIPQREPSSAPGFCNEVTSCSTRPHHVLYLYHIRQLGEEGGGGVEEAPRQLLHVDCVQRGAGWWARRDIRHSNLLNKPNPRSMHV